MPLFAATVVGPQGRQFSLTEDASDVSALRETLRHRNLWPLRIAPARPNPRLRYTTLPTREFIAILHQLELQLRAGVTADVALAQLADDAPKGAARRMLQHIHREVAAGRPIHEACQFFERRFPAHVAAVIAAGEASAQLPEALRALAAHLSDAEKLRRTARRALVYPVIVLVATAALIVFLLAGVVPQFAAIFGSLRLELPAITVALIAASDALRHGWLWLTAASATLAVLMFFSRRSARLRSLRDHGVLRVPFWSEVARCIATARFAAHVRLLIEAGVPLLDALRTGADLTGNSVLSRSILRARDGVALGQPLYAALPAGHAFPAFIVAALKAGETTGQLAAALRHIEDYAATCARERLATALALLEPLLLAALTAVVGLIALSFFLPLFSLLGGINTR
ncbi:MAG: type II secretion system F family protein [Opitutaceae bacterium]|nr:type II secretion system F family protein [Opitutaceae bacterium]